MTSVAILTCCSAEDPFEEFINNENNGWNNGSGMSGGNGSSATSGELASFDISIDESSAEPTETATEYFPEEEDALEKNSFPTEVAIDLSNPVAKTECWETRNMR